MRAFRLLLSVAFALLLAACGQSTSFQGSDISGASFGGDFTLTAQDGKPRKLSDFHGKAVALFFGYTQCPDVCPTTMVELKEVMKQLGPDADKVQVLFVSVDPARDTTAVLAQYVPAFDPRFIGLTGSKADVDKVAGQYKVIVQQQGDGANYTVDHSAGTYLIDKQGKLRVLVNYGAGSAVLGHDLRALVQE
ncbi:SCO family protein [Jeongeupia chitinilytica]|uniref:Photosynthetic protein synthase I n=1 Tax=Jeongeupia chitinilytica TaxID=1041641 RepID=A0ABQ3GVM0_9NEIS|nr:SCO family protein [Jeongeupia chitinilytica]GHD57029.1 photosynthetic protein synthase I [Jeongeupia chitinilytica]